MQGFICITSGNELEPISFKWKEPFSFQTELIRRKIKHKNYLLEQYTSHKFIGNKLWIDNDEFLCVTDGLILNLNLLLKKYNTKDSTDLIRRLYQNKTEFFEEFEGNFAGAFYDKIKKTWYVFNNQTGTKKLFYFKNKEYFIFSTDLYTLSRTLTDFGIRYSLDEQAAYLLISAGMMLENFTLINEIKQLRAGEYITYEKNIKLNYYFHLNNIKQNKDSKSDILHQLDLLFSNAVKLEFEMDNDFGFPHFCTLSGGLDSRMTSLVGYETGFKKQTVLNFSEKGYADEKIAKKIAEHFKFNLISRTILPNSLCAIDENIKVNDGLTVYTGCSHVFNTIQDLNSNIGIVHTGMIGDAVLGSFLSSPKEKKAVLTDGLYANKIRFAQAENFIKNLITEYKNEEIYKFYTRAYMGANNGYLYLNLIGETTSPFLNTHFLSYAYSIPVKFKYKEQVYIDWIKQYHPQIANFTWEKIGGKPTNNSLLRNVYKYKRAINKRLPIKSIWKNNMTPEQIWYDDNKHVNTFLDNYFYLNLERIDNITLRNAVENLHKEADINEKSKCITLVGAIKLLF